MKYNSRINISVCLDLRNVRYIIQSPPYISAITNITVYPTACAAVVNSLSLQIFSIWKAAWSGVTLIYR